MKVDSFCCIDLKAGCLIIGCIQFVLSILATIDSLLMLSTKAILPSKFRSSAVLTNKTSLVSFLVYFTVIWAVAVAFYLCGVWIVSPSKDQFLRSKIYKIHMEILTEEMFHTERRVQISSSNSNFFCNFFGVEIFRQKSKSNFCLISCYFVYFYL